MKGESPARLFPAAPADQNGYVDAMLVTEDDISCFVKISRPTHPPKVLNAIMSSSEDVFDRTYAIADWSENRRRGWGTIIFWDGNAFCSMPSMKRQPTLWKQLNLLWKSELRNILDTLDRDAPEGATKAELVTNILRPGLKKKQQKEVAQMVRDALLARDYKKEGRSDYTFLQGGSEMDLIFGWKDPAPRDDLKDADAWISELWDDPEDRHAPLLDLSARKLTMEAKKRAAQIFEAWKKRGIRVSPDQRERITAGIRREMAGLPTPERVETAAATQAGEEVERPAGWVSWQNIQAVPGAPWIDEEIIEDFARFLAGGKTGEINSIGWSRQGVMHSPLTGKWSVHYSHASSWTHVNYARLESTFGIPNYNGLRILDALLNLRQPKLEDEEATLAVLEKQDLILDVFSKWIWQSESRREAVEESYNKMFSRFNAPDPDGSRLEFPGMSNEIELFDYQKDAVQKILDDKNSLLAFDTGSGKTYIMIAAAMKLRQQGKSPKNMFVVPNNIVGQWEQMFLRMYPDAKLLIVDPAHFKPDMRAGMLRKMKTGDYDGIIIAYSCLEQIPLSRKWIRTRLKEQQQKIKDEIRDNEYKQRGFSSLARTVQKESEALESEAAKLVKQAVKAPPRSITFDQLGVTGFFLDEAHNYKNVPVRTSLGAIGGLNPTGSLKCLAMMNKVRCVQESPGGHGAVLATATPLSNSLADAFVMQRYVQPDELEATQLHTFDNWVKSFARPELVCEIDVDTSRFRYVKRLAHFFNIPELSKMFSSSTSFYAMNEKDGLPELSGYTNVLVDRGKGLKKYMDELCARTERIRDRLVPRTVDNMLKVSTEGRLAALDLRLVDEKQPYDKTCKVHECVEKVLKIYHDYEGCTQIVFCDYSTPKEHAFNVYDDVKKHLVERGVPEKEIAFIHSYTTESKRLELYRKVNNGEVRVLIGSTFKLGIGTNVQTRLKAVHHLDIPWRPADMVQREGRILRQGNLNESIRICRYITEGSFDAYSWQILERKQTFISQFLAGSAYERTATDLEDAVLTYAQVKSLAISEPLMKDLAEKENSLRRLRMLASNFVQTKKDRSETLDTKQSQLAVLRTQANETAENAAYAKTLPDQAFKDANQKFRDLLTPELLAGNACLVQPLDLLGFNLSLTEPAQEGVYAKLERNGCDYRVLLGDSTMGNARRVINHIRKLSTEHEHLERRISDLEAQIHGTETALAESNPYPEQIAALEKEIAELRSKIIARQSDLDTVAAGA